MAESGQAAFQITTSPNRSCMVPGEVFLYAPMRLIYITIRPLKIAEAINSTIAILGKCWTLLDSRSSII